MQTLVDYLVQNRNVRVKTNPTYRTHDGARDIPVPTLAEMNPGSASPTLGPLTYEGDGSKAIAVYEVNMVIRARSGTSVYEDPGRPEYYIRRDPDPTVEPVPKPVRIVPDLRVDG